MKELRFSGTNLKELKEYMKGDYSGISHENTGVGDIYVSELSTRGHLTDMHNVGCFILYTEPDPRECHIRVWAAGGGFGELNFGGGKIKGKAETEVYEDLLKQAQKIGLKKET